MIKWDYSLKAGVLLLVMGAVSLCTGCARTETIGIDLTTTPIRFIIDHDGWPRPFWWPRITEFAIATEEGDVWELRSEAQDGVLARNIGIVFGEVPPGFYQTFPEGNLHPVRLDMGRTYYAAAGGPKSIYRLVFALPVERGIPAEVGRKPTTSQPHLPEP
jgi:hypothetical protein